jgi:hypothetical protein
VNYWNSRRRRAGIVLACVSVVNASCYEYQPLSGTSPTAGQHVEFVLSDSGRVALGQQLGPGVLRVDGLLRQVRDGAYEVGVDHITTISGGSANWGGESVRIPIADVSQAGLRSLSRTRTALVAAAAVVGIGLFIASRSLSVLGGASRDSTGTGGHPQT